MSSEFEWWEPPPAEPVPCRRQSCGHRVNLTTTFSQERGCRHCGDALPFLRGPASRDYVPSSSALTWTWAACTKQRHLKQEQQGVVSSVEHLVAAISSPHGHSLHLQASPLRTSHRPPPGAAAFLVWRAATAGCTVHGGTIELVERGVLLLAGRGAHFHGTSFTGGVIMCAGAEFSGSFQNCTFRSTTVYAVHAACTVLRDCRITSAYPGLVASGHATIATLSDCRISGCRTSIIVERGAALTADSCAISHTDTGVTVGDPGSHAALAGCELRGGLSRAFGAHAVAISSAAAHLSHCYISNFIIAVFGLYGTCMAVVHDLLVEEVAHGVNFGNSSKVGLRECNIAVVPRSGVQERALAVHAGADRGQRVRGNTCMQLERCDIHGKTSGAGIVACRGSAVAGVLCRMRCERDVLGVETGSRAVMTHCRGVAELQCMRVLSDGMVRLRGGCYKGQTVCMAKDGARVAAADCEFQASDIPNRKWLVSVLGTSAVRLLRCHIHDSVAGVCCYSGGSVHAVDTTVCDMQPVAATSQYMRVYAYLCTSGKVVVKGGTVERCGVGLISMKEPAQDSDGRAVFSCSEVVFTAVREGVKLTQPGCEADVTRCEFWGLNRDERAAGSTGTGQDDEIEAGISFVGFGGERIEHCKVSGFPASVLVDSPDGVRIQSCTFQGSMQADLEGTHIEVQQGEVAVEDCSFTGATGVKWHGVCVSGGGSCTVNNCGLAALGGAGIDAAQGSTVKVLNTAISGCREGVAARDAAELAVQDCQLSDVYVGMVMNDAGGVCSAKRVSIQADYRCVYISRGSRARTVLKIVNCVMSGAEIGLCVIGDFSSAPAQAGSDSVAVSALRCHVSNCPAGVMMRGPVSCRMKNSRVEACVTGVVVGGDVDNFAHPCSACGRSGEPARRAACDALLDASTGAAAGARCTHEGAMSRLSLTDVTVADCEAQGVVVNVLGHVEASGLEVSGSPGGIFEWHVVGDSGMGESERSTWAGCTVRGCRHGAVETIVTPGELMVLGEGPYDSALFPIAGVHEVSARSAIGNRAIGLQ